MTKPLNKTNRFCIIAVLLMLTIVLGCFTTACTSAKPQEVSEETTPPAAVQPNDSPNLKPSSEPLAEPERLSTSQEKQPISDEALQALHQYRINNEQTFVFEDSEDYYGDKILTFFGDYITLYGLFESDLSLKILGTKTYDTNLPVEISEDEAKTIILDLAKKYWPDMEPEITEYEYKEKADYRLFNVKGVLKNPADQTEQPFWATVNGKGELIAICRTPKIDVAQCIADGTALSLAQAKEHAYEYLKDQVTIVNMNNLKTVSEKLNASCEVYGNPQYIFEFEYRPDHPTTSDYDYDAYIAINPSTGEPSAISINPIVDNINVISIEEAEKIAKEYIVRKYNQELKDITTTFRDVSADPLLFYSFCFEYGSGDGCSITVSAETGEIDGICH